MFSNKGTRVHFEFILYRSDWWLVIKTVHVLFSFLYISEPRKLPTVGASASGFEGSFTPAAAIDNTLGPTLSFSCFISGKFNNTFYFVITIAACIF